MIVHSFHPHKSFLSTLSLRRATEAVTRLAIRILRVSIHALLAESDTLPALLFRLKLTFLSTLSLRRATPGSSTRRSERKCFYPRSPCGERLTEFCPTLEGRSFYPRSPCGERHDCVRYCIHAPGVSIHALLAESDIIQWEGMRSLSVSIHALLAESDLWSTILEEVTLCFYPRSPCGERHIFG